MNTKVRLQGSCFSILSPPLLPSGYIRWVCCQVHLHPFVMKSTALFCCVVIAALILTVSAEDVSRAQKQYDINFLLWKVNERLRDRDLIALAQTFNPEDDLSKYTDGGDAIHKLMNDLKGQRLLQRKHWFSLFKPRHREEALMLFDVIMNCKDWETAISNAAYFRERMNEGEFVYALYVTVIHYPLAEHIVLPPLYEVTPHLFTNAEVIRKAYNAKMTKTPAKLKSSFTGTVRNPEQRVAYFREDIGMNIHHVLWHMEFPFWWKDSYGHKLNRKGETFYWVHHQLTCRFDAERLSNSLPPVEELHWDQQIHEGFAPHTTYKYGGSFPSRPDDVYFKDVDGVARIRDMIMIDSRIRDAIAHGYVINEDGRPIDIMNNNGINILGDIIESSMYSPNVQYYGALHNTAHIMLGRQADPQGKYGMPPGVMEHFETATRDPGFFRLHKYVDNIFREHKDSLPSYTKDQLDFEGVSVENFAIDGELKTFFEDFGYNLINAVDDSTGIDEVEISAYVSRMAHKPFNFSIDINNNKGAEALATVRIFAWPHVDHNGINFSFDDGRWNAIELDKFWIKLQPGDNHIVRGSTESGVTSADVPSFMTLMDRTVMALFMETELDLHEFESATGLPNRFLIPKGHSGGMELDVFIAVTDGEADAAVPDLHTYTGFNYFGIKGVYPDNQPHGYPLDRRVNDERIFHDTTNFKHIIVKVYNKGDDTHYDE